MKKSIATKWVKALRSGKFIQGRQALEVPADVEGGTPLQHCCLGVLCAIVGPSVIEKADWEDGVLLPEAVQTFAGMQTDDGQIAGKPNSLTDMNDQGQSFKQIANYIERNYKAL